MSETNKANRKSFDFSIESLLKTDFNSKKSEKSPYLSSIGIEYDVNSQTESDDFGRSEINHFATDLSAFSREDVSSSCEELNISLKNPTYQSPTFSWLNCTRFKPPKLPRSRKRGNLSKRLGRGPRIPFTPQQIAVLENTFNSSQYLSSDCICRLAHLLHLSETRVKIWFQNRRARYRRERDALEKSKMGLLVTNGNGHNNNNNIRSYRKRSCNLSQLTSSQGQFLKFQFNSGHQGHHHDDNNSQESSSPTTTSGLLISPHLLTHHTPQHSQSQQQPSDESISPNNLHFKEKKFSLESCEDSTEESPLVVSASSFSSSSPSASPSSEFPFHRFSQSTLEFNINALNSHLGLSMMNLAKKPKFIGNNLSLDAPNFQIYKSIYP